jgi:hypothetical protein
MKEYKQIEFVSSAQIEIHYIHDSVGLLQEIQSLLPLFTLDKLDRRVIQLAENDRDLIFRDT